MEPKLRFQISLHSRSNHMKTVKARRRLASILFTDSNMHGDADDHASAWMHAHVQRLCGHASLPGATPNPNRQSHSNGYSSAISASGPNGSGMATVSAERGTNFSHRSGVTRGRLQRRISL